MSLADAIQMYLQYLGEVQQASKHTISAYQRDLYFFLCCLRAIGNMRSEYG